MGRRIAAVALDDNFSAGIEPAHIGRGRAFHIDFRIIQAHAADPLPRIRHVETQFFPGRMP